MLTALKIQNLALVERVDWSLSQGLIAVTGETGAGKSVIIGALKLIAGDRADKGVIRYGEEKAVVQAVFKLRDSTGVASLLDELGLEACEDGILLIKRIISQKSGRQFINDQPCTLSSLKRLGVLLMDLHGPHDHQSLISNDKQLRLLDRYANLEEEVSAYCRKWWEYTRLRAEYEKFVESEMLSEDELDLYRYQLDEITKANLAGNEMRELEEQYNRASNASEISQSVSKVLTLLDGENGLVYKFNEVLRFCRDLENFDKNLEESLSPLRSSLYEVQEVESALHEYLEGLDLDPLAYDELEDRMNHVENLKRKYGGSIENVLGHAERIERKLNQTEERESMIDRYQKDMANLEQVLTKMAAVLTNKRQKSAPLLAAEISQHLQDLGFKQAMFEVDLVPCEKLSVSGVETVEFVFGPNPGEEPKALRLIASSGEMSRVMLALKSSLADHDEVPVLVFDEIDANVGGEIVTAVGNKMKTLSESRQVLSITHFPQVAAIAPSHCLVQKQVEEGRTLSRLKELGDEERVDEIVRMLGAAGEQARALAVSLLAVNNK